MKKLSTILAAGILAFFFSSQIGASGIFAETGSGGTSFMAEAIEHAEIARKHKAHAEHIHEHAKESLEYVKKAEIEAIEHGNSEGRVHITSAIQHLVEAIRHAKIGHASIAGEYVTDALEDMRHFMNK